jgi:hypothetical protein
MKRVTNARDTIPVLAKVEPGDRALVLEGDSEAEDLRVETDGSSEICHVEVDMGHIDWRTRLSTIKSAPSTGGSTVAMADGMSIPWWPRRRGPLRSS